jgi:hypothetical protein
MFNRRKSKRLETAVPVRLMLLGMSKPPPTIETATTNISPVGMSINLPVTLSNGLLHIYEGEKPFDLIPYLVLGKKEVALEITLPPHDEKIKGKGKVIWYDFGSQEDSYYFKAGIFLKEIETEDRKRWERFVRDTALKTGKVWHYMQIASAFTFIAGIVIFIAGFEAKLAATAKIGFFVSLIGLIGFVIGWWRHRSFMLFKKFRLV